ncbi:hypothetical protein [Dyella sp.]|uniref:hypothetical protein n=2 Tax=Dyella sp. TaxID=1869338 RepID=UPI002D77850C|nr:hypothetical protein [Dyella sp.]HET7330478.1 hypothetical protein [Dyella sp.]
MGLLRNAASGRCIRHWLMARRACLSIPPADLFAVDAELTLLLFGSAALGPVLIVQPASISCASSTALAQALKKSHGQPVVLSVKNEKDRWIYIRMTHDIPAYDGVKMGENVKLAEGSDAANDQAQEDGSLKRLP